ncbi:MAG: TetR family transcriptional regulator [Azospirillum sp.]|nr:TetR family transcriptional regulator [Azospirillum sp.]
MIAPSHRSRGETAEQILDTAEMLLQTRGYSAISYQHIAEVLGIRKASIHYHFPSKGELGIAVVDRYAARFQAALDDIAADQTRSALSMLAFYVGPYLEFAETPDRVCLCGALAGELMALPVELRARVEAFFVSHQAWLAGILERGVARGEFRLLDQPSKVARLIFGALQGGLIVKRTTGDIAQLHDVVTVVMAMLR